MIRSSPGLNYFTLGTYLPTGPVGKNSHTYRQSLSHVGRAGVREMRAKVVGTYLLDCRVGWVGAERERESWLSLNCGVRFGGTGWMYGSMDGSMNGWTGVRSQLTCVILESQKTIQHLLTVHTHTLSHTHINHCCLFTK